MNYAQQTTDMSTSTLPDASLTYISVNVAGEAAEACIKLICDGPFVDVPVKLPTMTKTIRVQPYHTVGAMAPKSALFVAAVRVDDPDPAEAARAALATRPPTCYGCVIVAVRPSDGYVLPDGVLTRLEELFMTTDANALYFITSGNKDKLAHTLCAFPAVAAYIAST